jgi:asparagine synthase (glutamine-hydrolysing)
LSAVAAIYHRDRSRVADGEVHSVLIRLAHRGADGSRVMRTPFAALAHQHHWTTPEEIGERQPLAMVGGRFQLCFDGRLDNRDDLLRLLDYRRPSDRNVSDAHLVLQAYERWGEGCFERLLGPFAAVVFEPLRRRLVCARDAMGSRTLFYSCDRRRIVVASEERAVVAHPAVDDTPDRRRLAWHLALRVPSDGSTFFREVREVLPGELLVVEEETCHRSRFRQLQPAAGLARLRDAECAELLAELVEQSVASRLRAVGRPAVLMSGGLDSTSVAAVATRSLGRSGGAPPRPISWVFDELQECDERRFIESVARAIGARPVLLNGDTSWPLRGLDGWAANPSTPEENPYRLLKTMAYDTAAELGSRVLLTGGGGDQLWSGAAWWLADLVAAGRPLTAAAELARALATSRGRALGGVRRVLGLPALRRAASGGWLTAEALRLVTAVSAKAAAAPRARESWQSLLGAREERGATIEIFHAARSGIELRHPFRDLRLVEFALGLPAHQVYRGGRKKHLLRVAMRGLLPPEVLRRNSIAGLAALYRRGVEERERTTVRELLAAADPSTRWLVRSEWLAESTGRARSSSEELALWHFLALELWRRRHSGVGESDLRRIA